MADRDWIAADGMSAACFYDDCDWCRSATCACPCHGEDDDDWGEP